jgi:hypothetical protein
MTASAQQRIWQRRFESLIGFTAPALDLLLTAGDRASRLLQADDHDYYPIRPASEAFELNEAREQARRRRRPAAID